MATKKIKKTATKRAITVAEAKKIKEKFYALSKVLYDISENPKYYDTTRKYAKQAWKGLSKWRGDILNIPRMSNFVSD